MRLELCLILDRVWNKQNNGVDGLSLRFKVTKPGSKVGHWHRRSRTWSLKYGLDCIKKPTQLFSMTPRGGVEEGTTALTNINRSRGWKEEFLFEDQRIL